MFFPSVVFPLSRIFQCSLSFSSCLLLLPFSSAQTSEFYMSFSVLKLSTVTDEYESVVVSFQSYTVVILIQCLLFQLGAELRT